MMQTHPDLALEAGDTVILPQDDSETNSVQRLIEGLRDQGIEVISADDSELTLHASGHPCQGELADLYRS